MAKGPELPQTDSAEIEILIERLKQNKLGQRDVGEPSARRHTWAVPARRRLTKDFVPVGLRNVDTESKWSKGGYRG